MPEPGAAAPAGFSPGPIAPTLPGLLRRTRAERVCEGADPGFFGARMKV